jgi:tetratricopeptide (TPR) repeat protein
VHGDGTAPDVAHVPFIVVAPGLEPGRSQELVHHVDVLPTLLELLGVERPAGEAGLPLGRYWRDGRVLPERVLYTDVGDEVSAYQGDRFERLRMDEYRETNEAFRWSADTGWEPAETQSSLHETLAGYAAQSAPIEPTAAPDAAEQERLRALGYLEPETPDDVSRAATKRGIEAERRGAPAEAIAHYREALRDNPSFTEAANNLAWLLATSEPELRDAATAIELAQLVLEQDPESPAVLDTLAAAYAAAARYPEAVATQRRAIAALSTSKPEVRADFRSRLEDYEAQARAGSETGH